MGAMGLPDSNNKDKADYWKRKYKKEKKRRKRLEKLLEDEYEEVNLEL